MTRACRAGARQFVRDICDIQVQRNKIHVSSLYIRKDLVL